MAKILIVDDEDRYLKLYSSILMRKGYEVLTASGAKKGFDLAVSAQPDLILLDVLMPSADGVKAFEYLAENAKTKRIPVIFLTSLITEEEVEAARGTIGGREYLSKSTPLEKFVARVTKALSNTPGTPS